MSKLPAMPLWVVDYEKDTIDLSPEEDGIYGRFLRQLWLGRGQIPDDDAEIARRVRVDIRVWKRVRAKLGERVLSFGTYPLSYVCNKRVSKEWNCVMSYAAAQAQKGKRSAAIRQARAMEFQELKRNQGSTAVGNNGSTHVATAASTRLPTGGEPLLRKKDILPSELNAAREKALDEMPEIPAALVRQAPKKSLHVNSGPDRLLSSLANITAETPFQPRTSETTELLKRGVS